MTNRELEGKTALVTGASRGIGRAIAIKLAACGSKVALNYLTNDKLAAQVADEIESEGGKAFTVSADVTDAAAVKAMTQKIVKEWGKIDILVNNAGVLKDNLLLRMSDKDWDRVIDTHLRGAFLCTKYSILTMMDQLWGRIINISSLAGFTGNIGQANYSAAKGGLNAFTRSMARELGPRNITVNAIAPGFIEAGMTNDLPVEMKDSILSRIPLGRFGQTEDVAELAVFLASERAGYITAQVICIDGGVI